MWKGASAALKVSMLVTACLRGGFNVRAKMKAAAFGGSWEFDFTQDQLVFLQVEAGVAEVLNMTLQGQS